MVPVDIRTWHCNTDKAFACPFRAFYIQPRRELRALRELAFLFDDAER